MMEQRSQPGRGPGQPDDRKNYDAGGVFAQIGSVFVNGLPFAARFKKSVRVGSGAATLATFDGTDGFVMADGANAALLSRDRADSTKYFVWYENGTVRLQTPQGGDLWLIAPATGLITEPGWTNATLLNTFAGVAAWGTVGYYQSKPDGRVFVRGAVSHPTGGFNLPIFTPPAGLLPANQVALTGILFNGTATWTAVPVYASSGGVLPLANAPTAASTGYLAFSGSWLPGQ